MEDQEGAMDQDRGETVEQDPRDVEAEQERLARYAQRSALFGILAVFGVVVLIGLLYLLARGWIDVDLLEEILVLLVLGAGIVVLAASVAAFISGGMSDLPENTANRCLAVLGIWLAVASVLALLFLFVSLCTLL